MSHKNVIVQSNPVSALCAKNSLNNASSSRITSFKSVKPFNSYKHLTLYFMFLSVIFPVFSQTRFGKIYIGFLTFYISQFKNNTVKRFVNISVFKKILHLKFSINNALSIVVKKLLNST